MTVRIFATIQRGITDKTAVCVYPWELPILQLIHGQDVTIVSIDDMSNLKDGVLKVEKQKVKHSKVAPPDLRHQLEGMAYVDPDEDPARDPEAEFNRLIGKYGMDKEMPMACVERVYGQVQTGAFAKVVAEHARERMPKPKYLRATEEGLGKAPNQMTIAELREALDERKVEWSAKMTKGQLVDLLESSLAPEEA